MKDFFISYNSADKQWAEWIAWQLETAGYTTIIQAWDFRPGGNFVIYMQLAAEHAERTIAVLSLNYLEALYTQPEWAAAFAQDPTGEQGSLIPVRVRECELKGLLSQIIYIDFVGLDEVGAREKLLAGVVRRRAKPVVAPSFPGDSPQHTESDKPRFPGRTSASDDVVANGEKVYNPGAPKLNAIWERRLQDLKGHVAQDLALLKEYEDILRYEEDPRRRMKHRHEIEQLRKSSEQYQREYDELYAQITVEPITEVESVADQIQQLDSKLDMLLFGQTAIHDDLDQSRQTLLVRYDAGEQDIIAAITDRLDQAQLGTVQAILEAMQANKVSETEMHNVLDAAQQMLKILKQHNITVPNQGAVTETITEPKLDVKHRFKLTVPIIPILLNYEGEIELGSAINLETAWKQLTAKVRGK